MARGSTDRRDTALLQQLGKYSKSGACSQTREAMEGWPLCSDDDDAPPPRSPGSAACCSVIAQPAVDGGCTSQRCGSGFANRRACHRLNGLPCH